MLEQLFFAILSFFTLTNGQAAHDPKKNTKESSEGDHLRITTNKKVATRAKTSFCREKENQNHQNGISFPHMRKHTNIIQSLKN